MDDDLIWDEISDLKDDVSLLLGVLHNIVDSDDAASELFTCDEDRANNFADWARKGLKQYYDTRG